jgi:hypothetical protein
MDSKERGYLGKMYIELAYKKLIGSGFIYRYFWEK